MCLRCIRWAVQEALDWSGSFGCLIDLSGTELLAWSHEIKIRGLNDVNFACKALSASYSQILVLNSGNQCCVLV